MRRSEFCVLCRRQELQRRKEYQQEIKEMQRRVKGRPLLLEQVAQVSVKLSPQSHSTGVHVITPRFLYEDVTNNLYLYKKEVYNL